MDYGLPEQNPGYGEEEQQYEGHYEAEERNYASIDNVDNSAGVKDNSSASAGKLFVGGIAWETSEESFSSYFGKYGEISDSVIMMDKQTGRPRGFGFITFADPEVAERVLQEEHVLDGRSVEVKRTVPRDGGMQGRGVPKTKKIFVGGLPGSLNEDDLREYFSSYGNVVEYQIMVDHKTGRSRGFGFVTFENEEAVEKVLSDGRMHELGGKKVEIKRAEPKRSGADYATESRFRYGAGGSRSSDSFSGGLDGFGGKMGREYGGYGSYNDYGSFPGNYPGGPAGFFPGYGGYGYGYGFGGASYGGGEYGGGGGGFGGPMGYGGGSGYGVGRGGYGGSDYRYDGKGFGGAGGGVGDEVGGGYGPARGYGAGSGGYADGRGYGGAMRGRFHPYRK